MAKLITIIIPIYNEAENVRKIVEELHKLPWKYPYEILFINDGSYDGTSEAVNNLSQQDASIHFISFVKNFGHQMALKAGLDFAKGDAVICMDGDMQHPPSVIPQLIEQWEAGNEIVVTQRIDHAEIGFFKKLSSRLFYKVINSLSSIPISYGEADFRLLDKKVVEVLRKINEPDLFFRGLVRWVGFKTAEIRFKAEARFAGKSKYTFKKMFALALAGITSFSTKPLYLSIYIGLFCAATSLLVLLYALISFFSGHVIPGWTSTLIIMTFFSGIQLLLLGIVGLYIAKLFMQSKNRPLYIIGDTNYAK